MLIAVEAKHKEGFWQDNSNVPGAEHEFSSYNSAVGARTNMSVLLA